ncbi:hypothetical protein EI94DRAFT_1569560 [Lactarius quietus]|nr:hypothetical protein EI94DRAFT_1569560 [Lactarius quietus]
MLHALPVEVTLKVLSHLPILSLVSLRLLSHQWSDFFTTHKSVIFHGAALYHGYIPPGTGLEDALSMNMGRPLAGSTSWTGLFRRLFQVGRNWSGKGRAVARELLPPAFNVHRIKVDKKAGICITTCLQGGLTVTHLFSGTVLWHLPMRYVSNNSDCEYDNGYLVFDRKNESSRIEVWRLASDFVTEGEVAADAPSDEQMAIVSARVAELYHHYAPRGQFRPWSLLRFDESTFIYYRLAYPTLLCGNEENIFLFDVRTGSLVQTLNIHIRTNSFGVDVNERHTFICVSDVVHVFSRQSGIEVLRIPAEASVRCSQHVLVEDPLLISGDWLITPLSVSHEVDETPHPEFISGGLTHAISSRKISCSHLDSHPA